MTAKKSPAKTTKKTPEPATPAENPGFTDRMKEAWKEVRKVGFIVFIIVSIPTIGIIEAISSMLDPKTLSKDDAGVLISIFTSTLPVTVGVMIMVLAWFRNWFSELNYIFFCVAVVIASTVIFNHTGIQLLKTAIKESGTDKLFGVPVYIFMHYLYAYGIWKTFSSLLLGAFGGWAVDRLYLAAANKKQFE